MKKLYFLITFLSLSLVAGAQKQMLLWQGGQSTRIALTDAGSMAFANDGATVTIAGTSYPVAAIDSLTLVHQVAVVFDGQTASWSVPAAVAGEVTVVADGAHVTVTNSNVGNEIEFILSGQSTDGSFTYNGQYKTTLRLDGLSLTSQRGAAIDIQCGKRIVLGLEDGTANTLADYAQGTQKAALYCKGHLEVEGTGTLNVTGNLTHAIRTKEYLQLKKSAGTLNILGAKGDALHVGQYYQQNGGIVSITSATQSDGIQVDILTLDDDVTPDPDKELNGQVIIKGGTLNIDMTHEDCKGIKCDGLVSISGGTFQITASGNGSRGIQTSGDMVIGQADGTTSITIAAKGGLCTNEAHEDDPHRCMGMKVGGNLTVNAGTVTVTNTGSKSRGIKVGGTYTKNGGTVNASIK